MNCGFPAIAHGVQHPKPPEPVSTSAAGGEKMVIHDPAPHAARPAVPTGGTYKVGYAPTPHTLTDEELVEMVHRHLDKSTYGGLIYTRWKDGIGTEYPMQGLRDFVREALERGRKE